MFAKRLKELRDKEGLTIYQVSKETHLSIAAIGNYENDENQPTASSILKLCKLLKCSSDYLIGLRDVRGLSPTALEGAEIISSMNRFEQDLSLYLLDSMKMKSDSIRFASRNVSQQILEGILNGNN